MEQAELQAEQEENEQSEGLVEDKKQETEEIEKAKRSLAVINAGADYLECTTIEAKYRWASAFIKGGMVPKGYKDAAQVLAGLEFARELNIPPLVGLKNIAVIHGNPCLWGDLPLALVRRQGRLKFIEEFIFDDKYERICFEKQNLTAAPYGALCRTQRLDQTDYYETWFTMDDAKKAGLLGRENVWKTYPRRMLQMRARSQNLKDQFPDDLLGLSIAEYEWNTIPDHGGHSERAVNRRGEEVRDTAQMINETL